MSPDREADSSEPKKQKFKRTRNGCLQCRKSKHKCDELHPRCLRCSIADKECTWPPQSGSAAKPLPPSITELAIQHQHLLSNPNTSSQYQPVAGSSNSSGTSTPHTGSKGGSPPSQTDKNAFQDPSQAIGILPNSILFESRPPGEPSSSSAGSSRFQILDDQENAIVALTPEDYQAAGQQYIPQFGFNSDGVYGFEGGAGSSATAIGFTNLNLQLNINNSNSRTQQSHTFESIPNRISLSSASTNGHLGTFMMLKTPSEALSIAYPDREERQLMQHFITVGARLSLAIPYLPAPLAPPTTQTHRPMLFLPLSKITTTPRGASFGSDALAMSLLSIAAIHQSSIWNLSRGSLEFESPSGTSDPLPPTGPVEDENQTRLKKIAVNLIEGSHSLVRTALALQGASMTYQQSDTLLSTCVSLCIAECLSGGSGWKKAFATGLQLIGMRGGCREMLERSKMMVEVGGDREALSRTRTMVEAMACIDISYSIGTGSLPSILLHAFEPFWFDYAPPDSLTVDPQDWDTVSSAFGVSRGLLELTNRVNILIGTVLRIQRGDGDEAELPLIQQTGRDILLELDVHLSEVDASRNDLGRLELGNLISASQSQVLIFSEILGLPHSSSLIQTPAQLIITLLQKSSQNLGLVVSLMWPAIISGNMMMDRQGRQKIKAIVETFRRDCCFDVDLAIKVLENCWYQRDNGVERPTWRDNVTRLGIFLM